jgi:hypothetical protein
MVGGRFRCLGSVPRLKSRFGGHLTLEMRCFADDDGGGDATGPAASSGTGVGSSATVDRAVAFVIQKFPGARVRERHGLFVRFEVPLEPVDSLSSQGSNASGGTKRGGKRNEGGEGGGGGGGGGGRSSATSLAETFRVVEEAKGKLRVADYAVAHGSLEQVRMSPSTIAPPFPED